ncbi:fimbrial biogenesis chaperone [Sphingopyxis sp. 550A]|jgi:fimbrial chaperone protein
MSAGLAAAPVKGARAPFVRSGDPDMPKKWGHIVSYRPFLWALMAAVSGLGAVSAEAARVTPMIVEMTPTGRGATARVEVTNTDAIDLPVEIRMYRGKIDETGQLELEPAEDHFAAYPPQVVIPPNGRQIFRVQFIPQGEMTQSEIYYASISQLPVKLEEAGSRIQMLMRFNILLNVVPDGTVAKPALESVQWVDRMVELPPDAAKANADKNVPPPHERGLEVRVTNGGTRYFAAGRTPWSVKGVDETGAVIDQNYDVQAMSGMIGMGIVAPGRARTFVIPMERKPVMNSLSVSFEH